MISGDGEGMEDMEDEGFRPYGSSEDMNRSNRPAVIVLAFLLLFAFLAVVGVWNSMHVHAPATTTVFWNGQYDAQTNDYLYNLRHWVDPNFIFNPHRTTFFDGNSDGLMAEADSVCRQFANGVSYHQVETQVGDQLILPASPALFFIGKTVDTYCPKFGPMAHSNEVTATGG